MINAIFFDFDGVIMDSMALKVEAYRACLSQFNFDPEQIEQIVSEFMGQSRRRIIVELYERLKGEPIPPEVFEAALETFNRLDDAAREKMVFLPGSLEFIQAVYRDHYTAIVTGTPEEFILKTTAYHDLDRYFDAVRGSPDTKRDILAELLGKNALSPAESIFIGDGKTDQDAAEHHGMRFVGMDSGHASFDPESAWRVVRDLRELLPEITTAAVRSPG